MVAYFGMSKGIPNIASTIRPAIGVLVLKPYSENKAELIDEVKTIVNEAYKRAKDILTRIKGVD